jgi:hypothetical protein
MSVEPRVLPSPTSALWQDVDVVCALVGADRAAVHRQVHTRPQPDCRLCPPLRCPCGVVRCPDAFDHRRAAVSSETAWRAVA